MKEKHLAHMLVGLARDRGEMEALVSVPLDGAARARYSWRQLEKMARSIACALVSIGIPEGGRVAIFSPNRPEWTIADFGVHMARGIAVPIYSTSTTSQVDYILNDSGSTAAFAGDQESFDKLASLATSGRSLTIITFDEDTDLRGVPGAYHLKDFLLLGEAPPFAEEVGARLERARPEDLFTLIYTSGTTGDPKGVMLDHAAMVGALVPHEKRIAAVGPGDASLCFLPLSHVYERCWTYYALYRGMSVHYLDNPARVKDALPIVRPAVMCTVPRLFEKIHTAIMERASNGPEWRRSLLEWAVRVGAAEGEFRRDGRRAPAWLRVKHAVADRLVLRRIRKAFGGKIKFMPCGGAPISPELESFFWAAGLFVVPGYGLTETTATVSCYEWSGFNFGSVGKPLDGIDVKIADDGEILVKSYGVMRGYWNRPAETADSFVDGWFRTGDAGKLDAEGRLSVTDRIKDIIKTSGGKLVAPQLIEAAACRDPYIEQAAVVGDLRHFITALIVPAFETLSAHARSRGIRFTSVEELVRLPEIVALYEEKVAALNKTLARFEQIRKFAILPRAFTVEEGEITPTLKVRRRAIAEKYRHILESLYAGEAPDPLVTA